MNSDFETIIKQKLESRTYDFQESSWEKFQDKQRSLKLRKKGVNIGVSAIILGGLVTVLTLTMKPEVSIPESPVLEENNIVLVQDTLNDEPQAEIQPEKMEKTERIQSVPKPNIESSELILELPEPLPKNEVKIKTDNVKPIPQKRYNTAQEDSILLEILNERQFRHDIPINSAEPDTGKRQTSPRKKNRDAR